MSTRGGDLVRFNPDFFLVRAACFALLQGYHKKLHWENDFRRDGVNCYPLPYFEFVKISTNLNTPQIDQLGYMDFYLERIDYWQHYFKHSNIFMCVGSFRDGNEFLELTAAIKYANMVKLCEDLSKGRFDGFDSGELLERLMLGEGE